MENKCIVQITGQMSTFNLFYHYLLFFLSMMIGEALPPMPPLTARHCWYAYFKMTITGVNHTDLLDRAASCSCLSSQFLRPEREGNNVSSRVSILYEMQILMVNG